MAVIGELPNTATTRTTKRSPGNANMTSVILAKEHPPNRRTTPRRHHRDTDKAGDRQDQHGPEEAGSGTVHGAGKKVAAQLVGSQPVCGVRIPTRSRRSLPCWG